MKLPLFPLNTVLFPGCVLDLQLFEARYLDMISRCLKEGQGFGVVGLLEGSEVGEVARRFGQVGCEAVIRDWQQLPNGLLGIRVEGARRFDVQRAEVQRDRLTVAEVTWLEECQERPLDERHADLAVLLKALACHPMVESLGMVNDVDGQLALADRLAYLLPFTLEQKQQLLETNDPSERLDVIQQLLERLQDEAVSI